MPTREIFAVDSEGTPRALYDLPEDFDVADVAFDGNSIWAAEATGSSDEARICRLLDVDR
jgi:hypothetical protein